MNTNETVLLALLKKSLFDADVVFPEDTDWDAVQQEAAAQTVSALAAAAVPATKSAGWRTSAAQSIAHYMRVLYEQTNLIRLLQANNIPMVIIKGTAAAVYYPDPKCRTMGDIDFVVPEEYFQSARAVLDGNGYVCSHNDEKEREYCYIKDGIDIELHRRYSDKGYDLEPAIMAGLERAVTRTLNGHSFPSLPDYENGLLILDHLRHHLKRGLGLRQIADWAVFVNCVLTDEVYFEHFLPLIKNLRLVTFCQTVTKMCKMYLGLPDTVTWCDGADENTATDLMHRILQKGNFGCKEIYEEKPLRGFMFFAKKNGYFKTLQENGVENFPVCRKYRVFRAFAWLFQLVRYVWRGFIALLRGENLMKDASDGKGEADFYQRLGL